jgi:hypothetical protein
MPFGDVRHRMKAMDVLADAEAGRRRGWKRRLLVALPLLLVAALGAAALAVYAYDRSQRDRIAAGIRVAGVDIGGLSTERAEAKLRRVLLPRYRRPLVLTNGERRFALDGRAAGLRVDIAAAVADAHVLSRHGNLFHRVYRELRGRRLTVELEPRARYSPPAVTRFLRRLQRKVHVSPRSARFLPSLTRPRLVPAKSGLALRVARLRAAIESRLPDPYSRRLLPLPTRTLAPKVTTAAALRRYRYFITVDRSRRRLRLFVGLKLSRSYVIAVGRVGLETPAGLYRINDKQVDPSWHVPRSAWAGSLAGRVIPPGPADPLKARWMGFYDGAGIHGTSDVGSLGTAASHGCIRMSIPDVIDLYNLVPLHTPIFLL